MQVKIKSIKLSNGWFNLVDYAGKEISVMAEKCPILKPKLEEILAVGSGEADMDLKEKNGKWFGWDMKAQNGGGGKPAFVPKDTKRETALTCAVNSKMIPLVNADEILKLADKYLEWLKK